MDSYLGIDFGGTKLLIGEVDKQGKVLSQKRYMTGIMDQRRSAEYILACLADFQESVGYNKNQIKAVGVGIIGVVDEEEGQWISMDHRETVPIPLADQIKKHIGLPVFVDNDVKSAVMSEVRFGCGRESRDFIYINVGTGLAAAIVTGGRLLRGAHNNAGEIGHMVQDSTSETECICGRRGCVEGMASGSGLHAGAMSLRDKYATKLKFPEDGSRISAGELFILAEEGDELCVKLYNKLLEQLSVLIMNLVRVTDPDTVVLGGGIAAGGKLLPGILGRLNEAAMRGVTNGVRLSAIDAGLSGLIGAAAHAMTRMEEVSE